MLQWLAGGCVWVFCLRGLVRFRFLKCALLVVGVLQSPDYAVAGSSAPAWATPTQITSEDGYASLEWVLPEDSPAGFVKITETYNDIISVQYVEATSLLVWRVEPGKYQYTLQACVKNIAGIAECGDSSKSLTLKVTDAVTSGLFTESIPESLQSTASEGADGGPEQLLPGHWHNPAKDGHGWSFYWANRLALPQDDTLFGNSYDLLGVWYTYEAKLAIPESGCSSCSPDVSAYRPVVLTLKAVSTGPGTYAGGLYISRNDGSEVWVGSAGIIFGASNASATINWSANFKKESLSGSDSLTFLHGSDPTDTTNISHFSGIWQNSGDDRYFVVTNLGETAEVITVVFHDDYGDPTWIQAVIGGMPKSSSTSFCLAYQYEGYSPQWDTPWGWTKDWRLSGCNPALPVDSSNRNGRRYFSGLDTQKFWANFTLPGTGFASGSISIGTSSSTIALEKSASFHGVFFDSAAGTSCEVSNPATPCTVNLSWYTDGNYPDATVYAYNQSNDSYYKVLTSTKASMVDIPFQIPVAGVYEFQLRMGNGQTTTLMAKSGSYTVTENIINSSPVLMSPMDQVNGLGDAVQIQLYASDPDVGDVLTYSASGLPAGLSVNAATGLISGTITTLLVNHTVTAMVQDNHAGSDSKSFSWNVLSSDSTPETPPRPAAPPGLAPSSSSSMVGATIGEFRVDESGSATYSIPILSAPASGGVAPQVALSYSSQAGNGDVGVGWALSGVSVISLCPQTMEQDGVSGSRGIGLDGHDRFCLDGQRLIADTSSGEYGGNGTEYRTEIESFARITSYGSSGNGPAWFKVERKNGSVVEYGKSADSRIEARGSNDPDTVFAWAQNRFEDRSGNYILHNYIENSSGPVAYALESIDYTGNVRAGTLPSARLSFAYSERGSRLDLAYSFFAGVQLEQGRLLQSIRSQGRLQAGSPLQDLRFYQLEYEEDGVGRSILTALTECRSPARIICYQPTRFSWLKSESKIDTSAIVLDGLLPKSTLSGLLLADASGDGRPDLLYTKTKSQRHFLHVKVATASASFVEWSDNYRLPKKSDGNPPQVFAIDINSDGFNDVVYAKYTKASDDYSWVARVSNGSGFSSEIELNINHRFFLNGSGLESRFRMMDFDGDGLSDILYVHTVPENIWRVTILRNTTVPGGTPSLSAPIELDVENADLFPDQLPYGWELNSYPAFFSLAYTDGEKTNIPDARIFDFNGDGAVDLLLKVWRNYQKCVSNCVPQEAASSSGSKGGGGGGGDTSPEYLMESASFWVLMESDGQNGFHRKAIVALGEDCTFLSVCGASEYANLPTSKYVWPIDVNADGLADLAWGDTNNNWYFQINTGRGYAPAQRIGQVPDGVNKLVRFEDWNGDGYPDLIYPSATLDKNAKWMIYQNHFGRAFAASSNTQVLAGNVGGVIDLDPVENDSSVFTDFDGDGKIDQLLINKDKNGGILSTLISRGVNVSGSRAFEPANVITLITGGLGGTTEIAYKPLTDADVYTRAHDSIAANWGQGAPVYDYIAPFYVVSEVSGSSPTFENPAARNHAEYHYVGSKLQAGGRGLLGFAEVIVYDPQLRVRTNTRYRQDFPFTGVPVDTARAISGAASKFSPLTEVAAKQPPTWPLVTSATKAPSSISGTLLSYSANNWQAESSIAGIWQIHSATSIQRNYTLSGNLESKALTQNTFDSFGNMEKTTVSTFADDGTVPFSRRTTDNEWSAAVTSRWELGSLVHSTVTHARSGKVSVTRKSAFEYAGATGVLTKEIIEPGNTRLQIATSFSYDLFGNRVVTSKQGAGMNSRTSSVAYDALGRFVVRESNALGQITRSVNSPQWDVFGNPLEIRNIDGVVSTSVVDLMGRAFASYNQTGAWQKTLYYTGAGSDCPSGTVWYSVNASGGGAMAQQCFDVAGRVTRKISNDLNNQLIFLDQYYDGMGQPSQVSEPYFKGDSRYWNETAYDKLGRIVGLLSAAGDDISTDYDEQAGNTCTAAGPRVITTTNALGQHSTEVKNVLGETTESFDENCGEVTYSYDAVGNLTKVTGVDGEFITMSYDLAGHKITMNDPDKGIWQYAYNALGEMTRQLDSKNQAIDFTYDSMGRVTNRRELKNVSSLTDTSYTTINREISSYRTSSPGKSQLSSVTYRISESGTVLHQKSFIYDVYGRVDIASTTIGAETFAEQTTYDQHSRLFQQFDASGTDHGLRYFYTNGHVSQVKEAREGTAGEIYQDILAMDARGNVTVMTLGNGVDAYADYEQSSGRLLKLSAYDSAGVEIQEVDYIFDVLGNLRKRHDLSVTTNLNETFSYDTLNRLKTVGLSVNTAASATTLSLTYDAAGNITYKSDVGTYLYSGAQPHAVSSAGGTNYSYDNNGNQTSGDGRAITYTVFDKPAGLSKGTSQVGFAYGVGNSRYQRQDYEDAVLQKTTLYLGSTERITENGSTYFKRYLGGVAIATYYPSTGVQQLAYLLKDHIGSIHSVLDEGGAITARMHFSAFGERQDTGWQTPLTGYLYTLNNITTRGFTGHEQVDSMGIIHQNGRVYDPKLGRFLQADPVVQAPKNSQSLNRYSYVLNNPLSYTDPTGYSFKSFLKKIRPFVAIASSFFLTPYFGLLTGSWVTGGALSGFVTGAIATGSIKGAVKGAFIGAATGYLTQEINKGIKAWRSAKAKIYVVKVNNALREQSVELVSNHEMIQIDDLFINGQSNKLEGAVKKGIQQSGLSGNMAEGQFHLFHNPTNGFIADTTESFLGKVTNTSSLSRQLAGVLKYHSGSLVNVTAHSQGTIILTNALRQVGEGTLTTTTIHLNGAAVSKRLATRIVEKTGASLQYQAHFFDAVPNIIGLNTFNPFKIIGSTLASPFLFAGPTLSQHSVYLPKP